MNYGADTMTCPACGAVATCESVDVGVGLYIKGDFACTACEWELDGPLDFGFITMDERPFVPLEAYND